jgi:hypothetical protein
MAAEIRAGSALTETSLEAIVKIYGQSREILAKELIQLYKSTTTIRTELGKLGQDTFVELADLSRDYYKIASAGNVNSKDKLDAYIKILGLEAKINKDMAVDDNQLFLNLDARATAIAAKGSPDWDAAFTDMFLDAESGRAVSQYRVGNYDRASRILGGDLASVSADPRAAELGADVQNRKETSSRLSSTAQVIRQDIGDLDKLTQIANSGNDDLIKQTVSQIAPTLEQATEYAKKFPGKDDISAQLLEYEKRIKALTTKLDEDPMLAIQSFLKSSATTKKRDVDFYKTIGSTKFQRWAASNNLQVGKMRPATTEADKEKVGYIVELNAVYEPGPDDQRSLVVAHNQSTMKPGSQLFTRRGLEGRRNVEVQVGTKGAEREVAVDASGKEVNPQEVAAKNKFVGRADLNGKPVYVREDGSGFDGANELSAQELVGTDAIGLTEEQSAKISGAYVDAKMKTFKTEKRPGEATGVQTLRGRETAMLPTDPADTLYVIETTDGRRVPIRESQMLGETVIDKAEPAAKTKLVEEPRMGLRKPLAMLRARGARLKEEAAPAEETEGPVGPLGRATGVMSNAEVKALPGTKFIELPARAGGVSAGTGAAIPNMDPSSPGRLFNPSRRGTGGSDSNEIARQAIERSIADRGGFAKPSAEAGRDIRKATGNEQTGAAAGKVGAVIPPIATGTPMNAPAMPGRVQYERVNASGNKRVEENYEGLGEMKFSAEELADMNTPATPAQKKARAMAQARRAKYDETLATAEQE